MLLNPSNLVAIAVSVLSLSDTNFMKWPAQTWKGQWNKINRQQPKTTSKTKLSLFPDIRMHRLHACPCKGSSIGGMRMPRERSLCGYITLLGVFFKNFKEVLANLV